MKARWIISFALSFFSWNALGTVQVAERHLLLLNAAEDAVWGSYMFGVRNNFTEKKKYRAPILLPESTVDFQAQQGISQEDIIVDESGDLYVEREFEPGMTLIAIGFKVNAFGGSTDLLLKPKTEIGELSVYAKKELLSIKASNMRAVNEAEIKDPTYMGLITESAIIAGNDIKVEVIGVPKGRGIYWMIGGIFSALLVLSSLILSLKTSRENTTKSNLVFEV